MSFTINQNIYSYAISKFLPTSGFKWIDPKEPDLNKHTSNSSRDSQKNYEDYTMVIL